MDAQLKATIERATDPSSFYWAFRDVSDEAGRDEREVEIRINVAPEAVRTLDPPSEWSVHSRDHEVCALFLRRRQPLTDAAVLGLIRDAIVLADRLGGRFHSWAHAPF